MRVHVSQDERFSTHRFGGNDVAARCEREAASLVSCCGRPGCIVFLVAPLDPVTFAARAQRKYESLIGADDRRIARWRVCYDGGCGRCIILPFVNLAVGR